MCLLTSLPPYPHISFLPPFLLCFLPSATAADWRSLAPPPEKPGLPGQPGEEFLLLQPTGFYYFVFFLSIYFPPLLLINPYISQFIASFTFIISSLAMKNKTWSPAKSLLGISEFSVQKNKFIIIMKIKAKQRHIIWIEDWNQANWTCLRNI